MIDARAAVGRRGRTALGAFVTFLAPLVLSACRREERFDGHPVSYWVAELEQADPERRAQAAQALQSFAPRSPRAAQALLSAFATERNADVHATLAETIGSLGESARPAIPTLLRLLDDSHAEVREETIVTLTRLRATEAVPHLRAMLGDADHDVRAAAAEALGHFGDAAAIPALSAALGDRISAVRFAAVEALAALAPPREVGVPAFHHALRDSFEDVRRVACTALARYGPAAAAEPELVRDLREVAAHDGDPTLRRAASATLDALGDSSTARPADAHRGRGTLLPTWLR